MTNEQPADETVPERGDVKVVTTSRGPTITGLSPLRRSKARQETSGRSSGTGTASSPSGCRD